MGGGEGGKWVMGIEEGTCRDEHWVLYGNQFDNKFHIKKKKKHGSRKFEALSSYPSQKQNDRRFQTDGEAGRWLAPLGVWTPEYVRAPWMMPLLR